jgi:hypothetical protein
MSKLKYNANTYLMRHNYVQLTWKVIQLDR